MTFPTISIQRIDARIGMSTTPGSFEQRQPKANLQMETRPAQLMMHSPPGELTIDQSRAWDALGVGPHYEMMNRIYSESKNIALQGIARIVEDGNRMAAIHTGENAIADIAQQIYFDSVPFDVRGPASFDNVDIQYIAHRPQIEVQEGQVNINIQASKPEFIYHSGKLDIYMQQYPRVEITPPKIDAAV